MADVFDVFQFNRENIIQWIKDFVTFFRFPRRYVAILAAKSGTQLLPQFLFYFLGYAASYLFISTESIGSLWKPAILNLASTMWTIILFCFSARLALGRWYIKELIIFVLSLSFFTNSIGLVLFSNFVSVEDYTYRMLYNAWMGVAMLVLFFGFPFIIQASKKSGIKLMLVNYVVINVFTLFFGRINFDKYADRSLLAQADPMYGEYIDLVTPLKQKDKIPVQRAYVVAFGHITTEFILQDIVNETEAKGNTEQNNVYRQEVAGYIEYLEKQEEKLKFKRNKKIAKLWHQYYQAISTQINIKVDDTDALLRIENLRLLSSDSLGRIKMYLSPVNFGDSIFAVQYQLKEYHNSIINSSMISDIPTNLTLVCTNFLSFLMDYGIDLLFSAQGRPYKEKFNLPKEDWF